MKNISAKITLMCSVAAVISGCASIKSIDEVKTYHGEVVKQAGVDAKKASVKFDNNEFNDVYKDDAKIKKVAILTSFIGWDSKALREASQSGEKYHFMSPAVAPEDYRKVVDAATMELKRTMEAKGFFVLMPEELAKVSSTYASIPAAKLVDEVTPNYGQVFQVVHATGSRYIDKFHREGELISKIASEAGVDALVSFNVNQIDKNATEADFGDLRLYGGGGYADAFMVMCVPNDKAKKNGVSFGLFGKPNHCGTAQSELKPGRYLPSTKDPEKSNFAETKREGFDVMARTYTTVVGGMFERLYEEGLE